MTLSQQLKELNKFKNDKIIDLASIKTFYKELLGILSNSNKLQEIHIKYLVGSCLLFVEHVAIFANLTVSSNKETIQILQTFLKIIGEFSTFKKIQNEYVAHIAFPLLEIVLRPDTKKWLGKKLLENFKIIAKNSNEKLRHVLGNSHINYLSRLTDEICSYGDFEYQLLLMESIFLMFFDDILKGYAHSLFSGSKLLQNGFLKISTKHLFYEIRKFLNIVNSKFKNVLTFQFAYAIVDGDKVEALQNCDGSSELWVDFNNGSKILSIPCKKKMILLEKNFNSNDSIEIIKIGFEDVYSVKMIKLTNTNFERAVGFLILFRLNSQVSLQTTVRNSLKLILFNSSEVNILEKKVLPVLFNDKFEKPTFSSQEESSDDNKSKQSRPCRLHIGKYQPLKIHKTTIGAKMTGRESLSDIENIDSKVKDNSKSTKQYRNLSKEMKEVLKSIEPLLAENKKDNFVSNSQEAPESKKLSFNYLLNKETKSECLEQLSQLDECLSYTKMPDLRKKKTCETLQEIDFDLETLKSLDIALETTFNKNAIDIIEISDDDDDTSASNAQSISFTKKSNRLNSESSSLDNLNNDFKKNATIDEEQYNKKLISTIKCNRSNEPICKLQKTLSFSDGVNHNKFLKPAKQRLRNDFKNTTESGKIHVSTPKKVLRVIKNTFRVNENDQKSPKTKKVEPSNRSMFLQKEIVVISDFLYVNENVSKINRLPDAKSLPLVRKNSLDKIREKYILKSPKVIESLHVSDMKISFCGKLNTTDRDDVISNSSNCFLNDFETPRLSNINKNKKLKIIDFIEISDDDEDYNLIDKNSHLNLKTLVKQKNKNVVKKLDDKLSKISFSKKIVEFNHKEESLLMNDSNEKSCVILSYEDKNTQTKESIYNHSTNELNLSGLSKNTSKIDEPLASLEKKFVEVEHVNDLSVEKEPNYHALVKVNLNSSTLNYDYNSEVLQEPHSKTLVDSKSSSQNSKTYKVSQNNSSTNEIIVDGYLGDIKVCNKFTNAADDIFNSQNSKTKTSLNLSNCSLSKSQIIDEAPLDKNNKSNTVRDIESVSSAELNKGDKCVSNIVVTKPPAIIEKEIITENQLVIIEPRSQDAIKQLSKTEIEMDISKSSQNQQITVNNVNEKNFKEQKQQYDTTLSKTEINEELKVQKRKLSDSFSSVYSKSSVRSSKKFKLYNPHSTFLNNNSIREEVVTINNNDHTNCLEQQKISKEPVLDQSKSLECLSISLKHSMVALKEYNSSEKIKKLPQILNKYNAKLDSTNTKDDCENSSCAINVLNEKNVTNNESSVNKQKNINILQNIIINPVPVKKLKPRLSSEDQNGGNKYVEQCKLTVNNSNLRKTTVKKLDDVIEIVKKDIKLNALVESLCKQMKIPYDGDWKPTRKKRAQRTKKWFKNTVFDDFNDSWNSIFENSENSFLHNNTSLEKNDNVTQTLNNIYEELSTAVTSCIKLGVKNDSATKLLSLIDGVLLHHSNIYNLLEERISSFETLNIESSRSNLLKVLNNVTTSLNVYLKKT